VLFPQGLITPERLQWLVHRLLGFGHMLVGGGDPPRRP